jgi:hypothetical protein
LSLKISARATASAHPSAEPTEPTAKASASTATPAAAGEQHQQNPGQHLTARFGTQKNGCGN